IAANLDKFPEGSVDIPVLFKTLVDQGRSDIIADNLDKFLKASVDIPGLVKTLVDKGDIGFIANNLEKFPEHAITPDIASQLLIDINDALSQHRFQAVHIWMQNMSAIFGAKSMQGFLEPSAIQDVLLELRRDGRTKNTKYLEACMRLSNVPIPEAEPAKIVAEEPVEKLPRPLDTRTHVVTDEVLRFYAGSYIEGIINRIMSVPDWKYKLDFKDRSAIEELISGIDKERADLRTWLKQYMIEAVSSELRHQPDSGLQTPFGAPDSVYSRALKEQILDFFDSASGRFISSGWRENFGGTSWSRIASAGYSLWASKGGTEALVDHIFDLQHNTGAIFDKNPDRVKQVPESLKSLLNMKRDKEIPDILSELSGICGAEAVSAVQARLRIVNRIAKKVGV
ncbi:TPA: hypothetical protein DCZ32_01075, partial [Candidatus Uhrbacteria bacterium]|nr:hypothetical protein [Candidatus Uhrbacteria bacterium]